MNRCILLSLLAFASCAEQPPAPPDAIAVVRSLGTFSGSGSQTIGVVSESGRLRIAWETRNESPAGSGTFRLGLHSGVSGRPIALIVDERGITSGVREVEDDPRPYNLMVESANVDWTFTVDEVVVTRPVP